MLILLNEPLHNPIICFKLAFTQKMELGHHVNALFLPQPDTAKH